MFRERPYAFFGLVALSAGIGAGLAMVCVPSIWDAALAFFEYQPSCNVIGIKVHGPISSVPYPPDDSSNTDTSSSDDSENSSSILSTSPERGYTASTEVEDAIRDGMDDPGIKGLYVDVDSEGGGAVGGQEIAAAFKKFGKPSVAVVHEMAASSGYLAAAGTDHIVASDDSMIGSIGITFSYMSQAKKDTLDGLEYEQLSSGPFKDMMSPDKPLTADERALIMKYIKESRDHFVSLVSQYRRLPYERVDALADGSFMLGSGALSAGLIDEIGGSWEAQDYLAKKIGEPVSICWR